MPACETVCACKRRRDPQGRRRCGLVPACWRAKGCRGPESRSCLAGYRDHPPARLDAVCDVLIAVSQLLADLPELAELDINPLWADADGVIALDARIRLSASRPAGAARFSITPYPAELARTFDWHGRTLELRPIKPEDEPQHRAFAERLTAGDLRLRFFSTRRELPRSELARLTQIDCAREMAFIATAPAPAPAPDGASETLGVVRAVMDPDNIDAEFAIVVRSDLKGLGLGELLFARMIEYLESRGTERMVGDVLHENDAMRRLALAHGFKLDPAGSSAGSLRFVLNLQRRAAQAG